MHSQPTVRLLGARGLTPRPQRNARFLLKGTFSESEFAGLKNCITSLCPPTTRGRGVKALADCPPRMHFFACSLIVCIISGYLSTLYFNLSWSLIKGNINHRGERKKNMIFFFFKFKNRTIYNLTVLMYLQKAYRFTTTNSQVKEAFLLKH